MRQFLLSASLLAILGTGACVDHAGSAAALDPQGPPPISNPDPTAIGNPEPGSSNAGNSNEPGRGGNTNPGGGNPGNGGKGEPPQGGQPVPEPGTMLLVGTGLAGFALLRRRRRERS